MKIVWSVAAKQSYLNIIEQIFIDWDIDIVERFEYQVDSLVEKIQKNPQICPESIFEYLHKCVINKHNSLIYRIKNKSTIEIVLLIFNKSDHIFSDL